MYCVVLQTKQYKTYIPTPISRTGILLVLRERPAPQVVDAQAENNHFERVSLLVVWRRRRNRLHVTGGPLTCVPGVLLLASPTPSPSLPPPPYCMA